MVSAAGYGAFDEVVELADYTDLDAYLGGAGKHSWSDDELQEAIDIEAAAQRRVCRIPAGGDAPDLKAALLRRGARFLDMKRQQTEGGGDSNDFEPPARIPLGRDQEIRRYEAPWRKVVAG